MFSCWAGPIFAIVFNTDINPNKTNMFSPSDGTTQYQGLECRFRRSKSWHHPHWVRINNTFGLLADATEKQSNYYCHSTRLSKGSKTGHAVWVGGMASSLCPVNHRNTNQSWRGQVTCSSERVMLPLFQPSFCRLKAVFWEGRAGQDQPREKNTQTNYQNKLFVYWKVKIFFNVVQSL